MTQMFRQGESLPVISEILGHRQHKYKVYLSVDIQWLMSCSLDVPPVPDNFYMQKEGLSTSSPFAWKIISQKTDAGIWIEKYYDILGELDTFCTIWARIICTSLLKIFQIRHPLGPTIIKQRCMHVSV